jgi:hypothetical protein
LWLWLLLMCLWLRWWRHMHLPGMVCNNTIHLLAMSE